MSAALRTALTKNRVIQKRLAAFKVNRGDARFLCLFKNVLDLLERERACLPRTAPHEAVVAFVRALIGQKDVQAFESFILGSLVLL
ncbi:MAG: hypothetical protein MZV70_17925 [Desulfobacterales bacterium]|nr:hypothetical protein [Desulfobacterales bacterium]